MRSNLQVWIIILGIFFSAQAWCGQRPDDLYRQGRFAEAEEAYAKLDMDNPKDIRFRYNRGCAAYLKGDYKGAMGAFSSVIRRTDDNDILFRAGFNMGNAAYKEGDFQSAADFFKQAIRYNPENEDARYNLELALMMLKKSTEEQGRSKQKGQSEQDRTDKGSKKPSPEKRADKQDQKEGNSDNTAEKREGKKEQKKDSYTRNGNKSESRQDLSGELRTLQPVRSEDSQDDTTDKTGSMINRKKAEALLDNIREDRSHFLQIQIPEGKRHGVKSGKAW